MFPIKMSDEVSYTIPLDFIDMNYIKRSLNRGRDPLPIWSINDGKQYYSVEILAGKIDSGLHTQNGGQDDSATKTDDTSLIKSYKCPICNFNIPINYWKSHNASLKHKTFLEIADLAMQRIRENMFQNVPDLPPCEDDPSTYFCESCSIPVAIIEKNYHETSDSHALCLKQDNLLHDLLMVYKGNNITVVDTEDNCLEGNLNVENGEVVVDEPKQTNDNVETIKLRKRTRKRKNRNEITPKSDNSSSITNDSYDADPELEILKEYFENVNAKLNGQGKVSVVSEDYLHIFVDDNRLQVNISNFHGFTLMDDSNSTFCVLCRDLIDYTELEAHCKSEKHMDNISMPLYDKHCIRSNKTSPWHIHCILCNIYTDYANDHFITPQHKLALNNCLILETNSSIDSHNSDYIDNEECSDDSSTSGGNNGEESVNETEPPIKQLLPSTNYLMCPKYNLKGVICKVCKVSMPFHETNITDHIMGNDHQVKYKTLLSSNKLQKTKNGFNCLTCDVIVSCKGELDHIHSRIHQSNVKNTLDLNEQRYCPQCNVSIDIQNFAGHEKGKRHLANSQTVTSFMTMNKDKNLVAQTYCHLCNTNIDTHNFTSHKKGKFHLQNVMLSRTSAATSKKTNIINTNSTQQNYCMACDINIDAHNFACHVKGKRHLKNLKKNESDSVNINIIESLNANINCVEQINKHLKQTSTDRKDSISSDNKDIISNDSVVNETDSDDETDEEIPPIVPQISADQLLPTEEYQIDVVSNQKQAVCKVCKVLISLCETNLTEHKMGSTHAVKYKTLLSYNRLQKTETGFKCDICDVIIADKMELHHINSRDHQSNKSKISNLTKEKYCEICNVDIRLQTFADHVKGKQHIESAMLTNAITYITPSTSTDKMTNLTEQNFSQPSNNNIETHNLDYNDEEKQLESGKENETNFNSTASVNVNTNTNLDNSNGNVDAQNFASNEKGEWPLKNLTHNKTSSNSVASSVNINANAIKKMFCQPCNINVRIHNLAKHERTKRHLNNLKRYDKEHIIICSLNLLQTVCSPSDLEIDTSNMIELKFCETCNMYMESYMFPSHEKEKQHLENVVLCKENGYKRATCKNPNIPLQKFCKNTEEDNIKVDDTEVDSVKVDNTDVDVTNKLSSPHYQMSLTTDFNTLNCKICDVSVPVMNIAEHIMSKKHKLKYYTLLSTNKVNKSATGFRCVVCQIDISIMDEIDHISEGSHRSKIQN
ncbi:putative uncharacterized protein DDB_G0282133 isoform X1 [Galleria mellonella]|uniref:U1-type domain-containing protein n=1 Tax=Galleria mellonella TaxID=7137 RepID=A0A6J3C9J9_GALME|nr:putative uncharacterized protein DDB_G0282133 isoform X1 [Galleria mellonella]XP_031767705.2 putative uncharacterized protein DDB_G0282133 isoform X1 [Galleria mellonella]